MYITFNYDLININFDYLDYLINLLLKTKFTKQLLL